MCFLVWNFGQMGINILSFTINLWFKPGYSITVYFFPKIKTSQFKSIIPIFWAPINIEKKSWILCLIPIFLGWFLTYSTLRLSESPIFWVAIVEIKMTWKIRIIIIWCIIVVLIRINTIIKEQISNIETSTVHRKKVLR